MNAITSLDNDRQLIVVAAADQAARSGILSDYQARRAANTLRHQRADLSAFADYLAAVGFYPPESAQDALQGRAEALYSDAGAWSGNDLRAGRGLRALAASAGLCHRHDQRAPSTVKQYTKLAFQAGALNAEQYALIRTVMGYQYKQQKRVDEKRAADGAATRIGKKANAVTLTAAQVKALKQQRDTPQGRRDALLLCLLLDHRLRVGEIAALDVNAVQLEEGMFTFYRAKVNKVQTHLLSKDSLRAAQAWFKSGDAPAVGKLLRASSKSKDGVKLGAPVMSERAITKRVEYLGRRVGVEGLAAHDGRHSWATRAVREKTDAFALQEAGGWNSLDMPRRYMEAARIANEGVKLEED